MNTKTIDQSLPRGPEYDCREDLRKKFPCCLYCECVVAKGSEVIGWVKDGKYLGWYCSDMCRYNHQIALALEIKAHPAELTKDDE